MNLKTLRIALKSKDLKKRFAVVGMVLVAYSLLSHIPVPTRDASGLQAYLASLFASNSLLGFANFFSGGAMSNFSILMMGLGPFINASIIMQLMTQVSPKLESLSKEGEQGRNKINYYTRMLTLPLSIVQGTAMVTYIISSARSQGLDVNTGATIFDWFVMVATVVAGTLVLMWLAEIVTDKGVGNGSSVIIMAGIVSRVPSIIREGFTFGTTGKFTTLLLIAFVALAVIYFVVMINEAVRNIPVSYPRRSLSGGLGTIETSLPIKLITAGVVPIIFALAFLSIPSFFGQIFATSENTILLNSANWLNSNFRPTDYLYMFTYLVLVIAFNFFYTSIVFKPNEIAENLQKQGGFIPGIRPGVETVNYLKKITNRLLLSGALSLGAIAIVPFILQKTLNLSESLSIGGTSVLILVSVIIETFKQIETKAVAVSYDKF